MPCQSGVREARKARLSASFHFIILPASSPEKLGKIKAKRKSQPFCAVGLLFIVLDTHTHGREREEDDNCLSWEKEKDVEDTAVKIRRTLVLTYTT